MVRLDRYQWHDSRWMAERAQRQSLSSPISIYEVHLGSWRRPADDPTRWLGYRDLAGELVEYVQRQGYTHIELLPLHEHPLTASAVAAPTATKVVITRVRMYCLPGPRAAIVRRRNMTRRWPET